jgi:formylglycine-generating enzyme required for sulfatase activity
MNAFFCSSPRVVKWLLLPVVAGMLGGGSLPAQAATISATLNNGNLAIPDASSGIVLPTTIVLSAGGQFSSSLRINLAVTEGFNGNLFISLENAGKSSPLVNQPGYPTATIGTGDDAEKTFKTRSAKPAGFALIPAGAFMLGASLDGQSDIVPTVLDAVPTVSTTVSAFYMAETEVTLSQWQTVYQWAHANGYADLSPGSGSGPNHPVHTVSWYQAVKWCNARSEHEGLIPVYYTNDAQTTIYRTGIVDVTNTQVKWTANGYRLPTEAEWEKAARGGLSGHRFPWGDTIDHSQANYRSNKDCAYDISSTRGYHPIYADTKTNYTSPVGSFAVNEYGLHDMAGNLWEWCWDWYGTPYAGGTNPQGASSGLYRILRGGSWHGEAWSARVAFRNGHDPSLKLFHFGFRLARGL